MGVREILVLRGQGFIDRRSRGRVGRVPGFRSDVEFPGTFGGERSAFGKGPSGTGKGGLAEAERGVSGVPRSRRTRQGRVARSVDSPSSG
jgi:hypothetical protein